MTNLPKAAREDAKEEDSSPPNVGGDLSVPLVTEKQNTPIVYAKLAAMAKFPPKGNNDIFQ